MPLLKLLSFFPQSQPCSQWCAPTTRFSISFSSTPSPSLASCSSLSCWCATRAGVPARIKKARTVRRCSGSKSLTWVIPPPAWTPLLSASTQAPWSKRGRKSARHYSSSLTLSFSVFLLSLLFLRSAVGSCLSPVNPSIWLTEHLLSWHGHGCSGCQRKSLDVWFGYLFQGFSLYHSHAPLSGLDMDEEHIL